MDIILQTTFLSAFSWMTMYEFHLKFQWSLFLRVQLTIFQQWFRKWPGADEATSHYLNPWWPRLLIHICTTQPQWVFFLVFLVQIMVWHWTGDKPLPETMLSWFTEVYASHSSLTISLLYVGPLFGKSGFKQRLICKFDKAEFFSLLLILFIYIS